MVRMAHFIPVISSWTVILYVADAVFNPRFGLANTPLAKLGLEGQGWLQDPKLAIPLLVFIAVWKGIGYIMVIYLAGLQSVPGICMKPRRSTVLEPCENSGILPFH